MLLLSLLGVNCSVWVETPKSEPVGFLEVHLPEQYILKVISPFRFFKGKENSLLKQLSFTNIYYVMLVVYILKICKTWNLNTIFSVETSIINAWQSFVFFMLPLPLTQDAL